MFMLPPRIWDELDTAISLFACIRVIKDVSCYVQHSSVPIQILRTSLEGGLIASFGIEGKSVVMLTEEAR